MSIKDGFYLGRVFDPNEGKTTPEPLIYDPDDLTTHAFVVGMTGSGKTGLCVDLMEEAALKNIPALMIDPKGDLTNLLLHFPDLAPEDFQPWVNADQARREGKSLEQMARETADLWNKGLAEWDISPERIRALQDAVDFVVYTPGSDAGVPVSIMASLNAPDIPWEDNRELIREKISSTVTALLGLVGIQDVDPVRSREHILLANLFEHAWSQGKDLSLSELILQTQNPPFEKLGVFDVNTFFPEKDRFGLAMLLNNILAAPAFQVWLEGQPLDIESLLYSPEGRARHCIFYIAHLNDAERMFFVTLLYSAVEAWMRTQPGTGSLRALVYFDEIYGYLPPVQNPSSKPPILRMLKMARAFGVGLVLVTQNPVDLDYKGLSNAGTWFIGKLQTERDKQRLLDGLEGASPGIDRNVYDRMISGLGKRVFLMHNVHEKQPRLFQTRWAMNFLAGPLTRAQIPALNELAGKRPARQQAEVIKRTDVDVSTKKGKDVTALLSGSETRPAVPAGVAEYFLPLNLTLAEAFKTDGKDYPAEVQGRGLIYRPALLVQARVRFFERKYNLDHEEFRTALVQTPDRRGLVRWEDHLSWRIDPESLAERPEPQARFAALEAPLGEVKILMEIQRDFSEWVYRSTTAKVRLNEALKVYAGPQISQADFRKLCAEAARQGRDAELEKVAASYDRKIEALETKLRREEMELEQDEVELSQRKIEEMGTHAENVFSLFTRRRRTLTTSLTKRRLTEKAKADVEESKIAIAEFKKQVEALDREKQAALMEVNERWESLASQSSEITVTPAKKDILIELFGVAWFPFYVVQIGEEVVELPGYGREMG